MSLPFELPRLHLDLPPVGGTFVQSPSTFSVEELSETEPSGSGAHLWLWIEKVGLPTEGAVRRIAEALGVRPDDVGTAGLKDSQATARQMLSVPAQAEAAVGALAGGAVDDRVRILSATRHPHRLRTGRLRGNRFEVGIDDVGEGGRARAEALMARIGERGFANFYGHQRFGRDGATGELGLRILRGEKVTLPGRKRFLQRLAVSAAQSLVFNRYLAQRMDDGLFGVPLTGDVLWMVKTDTPWIVDDVGEASARLAAGGGVLTGPMFGPKMRRARAEAWERELAALGAVGLVPDQFESGGRHSPGTRRPIAARPWDLEVGWDGSRLRLGFCLPPGAYATVLIDEINGSGGKPPA